MIVDQLRPGDHICWAFDTDTEAQDTLTGYVHDGLRDDQKVLYLVEALLPAALIALLDGSGVGATRAMDAGQLEVSPATNMYLPDGTFEPGRVMAALAAQIAAARRDGWLGLRVMGEMDWAVRQPPGVNRLAQFEADVNRLFIDDYAMALCAYDRRLFTAAELSEVCGSHPAVVVPGSSPDWTPQLRMRRTTEPFGVELSGEADATNQRSLRAVLWALLSEAQGRELAVDVSGLRFADISAARQLLHAAGASDGGLRITGCSPSLAWLLRFVAQEPMSGLTVEES